MKKSIVMFIVGLVLGLVLSAVITVSVLSKNMFVVHESKYGFNETIEQLEKSAAEKQWGIPHRYDLQKTLKVKGGYDVDPVNVFSLCKPEHAYGILGSDDQRLVSALMPCRVAVYEKDGKTYFSMLNAGLFSRFMGKEVQEVMGAASSENLEILEPLIN
ncbi:DUF302 domain-containing protein [Maribellus sediminis]|uniref:DUF302 domain-containing protein n=1 Tax=Maribellus sediminis TaxID=2696285 RepID=UPI001430E812|nr:DUF302 domain-containing protein [Maribellus sediminis]